MDRVVAYVDGFNLYFGLKSKGWRRYYWLDLQKIPRVCRRCNFEDEVPNEKMTDVNIAVEILADAFEDNYDIAYLISADSDLVPPVTRIKDLFPNKKIVIAFPPDRFSKELSALTQTCFTLGRSKLAKSLFPPEIKKADGFVLKCPKQWLREKS